MGVCLIENILNNGFASPELPVYKEYYDLFLELFQFTKEFGKDYKHGYRRR